MASDQRDFSEVWILSRLGTSARVSLTDTRCKLEKERPAHLSIQHLQFEDNHDADVNVSELLKK